MNPSDSNTDPLLQSIFGSSPQWEPPALLTKSLAEERLSWLLRPHWEIGVANQEEIRFRDECDQWLTRLLHLELLVSCDELPVADLSRILPPNARAALERLPVQRFIDDYNYFGVRFLHSRLHQISPADSSSGEPERLWPPLEAPPPISTPSGNGAKFCRNHISLLGQRDVAYFWSLLDDYQSLVSWNGQSLEPAGEFRTDVPTEMISKPNMLHWLSIPAERRTGQIIYEKLADAAREWVEMKSRHYIGAPPELQARFAIFDFFELASLFDCDVSTAGYASPASRIPIDWPQLLQLPPQKVNCLRRAWVLACHWIQGESLEASPDSSQNSPALEWRQVFRHELRVAADRRPARNDLPDPDSCGPAAEGQNLPLTATSLTGLAFSGGGIRSATFNLGVLEGLRDLDLLRQFDYLSTVSGGGYIGAWLAANVLRRPYWLRRASDWRSSIEHLRKYSNYLSPHVGLFSADTWTMLAVWSRNTVLVQLLVAFLCLVVLTLPYLTAELFRRFSQPLAIPGWFAALSLIVGSAFAGWNLWQERRGKDTFGQAGTQVSVVVPFIVAAFCFAAWLWQIALPLPPATEYSYLFLTFAQTEPRAYIVFFVVLVLLSLATLKAGGAANIPDLSKRAGRIAAGFLSPFVALLVFHLCVCAVIKLFLWFRSYALVDVWLAFTLGPSVLLVAFSFAGVILLGMLGRSSSDGQREWWSRLGAWLNIYSLGFLLIPIITVFGPYFLTHPAFTANLQWSALSSWVVTTAGSVIAARSARTGDSNSTPQSATLPLEFLAVVGPYIFIAGFLALLSLALQQVLLLNCGEACENAGYWYAVANLSWPLTVSVFGLVSIISFLLCWRLDINIFSLNAFYAFRLSRCYLGASRTERADGKFTGFDPDDDLPLPHLSAAASTKNPFPGPLSIINCTLNLAGNSDLKLHTRQSASFFFTPYHVGADRDEVRFVPLKSCCSTYRGRGHCPTLGLAVSVSGAAANPNMGYHTSTAAGFLLTLFNLRLGAWFPNPSKVPFSHPSPRLSAATIVQELFGSADDDGRFLNISDGGHFENLGIYELVRRRCRVILASDAECDPSLSFGSLGNVIRLCRVDHGATIDIDVSSIRPGPDGLSTAHCAVGTILYRDGSLGYLIYLKASLTGNEDTAVREYKDSHPSFPHETTADQFFSEPQFESYRMLGRSIALDAFRQLGDPPISLRSQAASLRQIWTPDLPKSGNFSHQGEDLQRIWKELRTQPGLLLLLEELLLSPPPAPVPITPQIHAMCLEILQLMENVYFDLALQDTWSHPDNSGWREQFLAFSRCHFMQQAWSASKLTFGDRFRHFCGLRLKLS
jgi:hypothetical protein